jgi:pseudaminic acid synthase
MEPHEFKEMVQSVRQAEAALGNVTYNVSENDKNRRRSLFIIKDIKEGELITTKNIRSIRPGYGLHPKLMQGILGKKAKISLKMGTPLQLKNLE